MPLVIAIWNTLLGNILVHGHMHSVPWGSVNPFKVHAWDSGTKSGAFGNTTLSNSMRRITTWEIFFLPLLIGGNQQQWTNPLPVHSLHFVLQSFGVSLRWLWTWLDPFHHISFCHVWHAHELPVACLWPASVQWHQQKLWSKRFCQKRGSHSLHQEWPQSVPERIWRPAVKLKTDMGPHHQDPTALLWNQLQISASTHAQMA